MQRSSASIGRRQDSVQQESQGFNCKATFFYLELHLSSADLPQSFRDRRPVTTEDGGTGARGQRSRMRGREDGAYAEKLVEGLQHDRK